MRKKQMIPDIPGGAVRVGRGGTLGLVPKPFQMLLLCIKQTCPVPIIPSLAWSAPEFHLVFGFEDPGTKRIAEKTSLGRSL